MLSVGTPRSQRTPEPGGGGASNGRSPPDFAQEEEGKTESVSNSTDSQTLFNIVYLIYFQFTLAVSRCAASGNGSAFLFVWFFAFLQFPGQKVLNLLPLFQDSASGDVGGLTITVISRKIRFTFSLASLKFIQRFFFLM